MNEIHQNGAGNRVFKKMKFWVKLPCIEQVFGGYFGGLYLPIGEAPMNFGYIGL